MGVITPISKSQGAKIIMSLLENEKQLRGKKFIFNDRVEHVFQPCGFDGSDLKTSRNERSRHFHLYGWA